MDTITTIIPAYNEEKTIGNVLSVVKEIDLIDRIIVVSDGSEDMTAQIARSFGVDVIELKDNVGKGGAIKSGVDRTNGEIILFLDADLIGLKPRHVLDLLMPVINEECDMSIGIFSNGRFATDLAQKLTPYLSGQRAIRRYIIEGISNIDVVRYGVEVALTRYVSKNNIKTKEVYLDNVTHVMKEEKLGVVKGFTARLKMYRDIAKYISLVNLKK
ncbi:glycosyltransferase family 2 protein [Caloranaerobacter azorensis]|uniref:Glucosyl-3-phosphoglycerate synthase n=2 Tax=Caloranaerobacter azorensis TaxID=116090 RepID=A0A1M5VE68_9FIRM|nr:glycosyltransferase family 2 protein [Caloranaerobacter azorensis]QIB26156.1 glycosyltransferase family 2 protein [Caloranaerobacter azorensis]SHH73481.1 Glycosyl transferase family 2 [Caloranaerobacter azorensis DSM 13643]